MNYSKEKTIFKLWAPTANKVTLRLYATGSDKEERAKKLDVHSMEKGECGVWTNEINGNLNGIYYDYEIEVDGSAVISADPYATACGVNGIRSMILDMEGTNPKGWNNDTFGVRIYKCPIIYELHIKDFSYDKNSGIEARYRGKYLAFTQEGTTLLNDRIHSTGIDYLKSLGITHVHLLPVFDYGSVDEGGTEAQFNWGYDPVNYNVPEGSYSTNPFDGSVRIREFKEMVLALHEAGISVIMDVVYNHTYSIDSYLQRTVPYYYYRQNGDGSFSNGSACGNDTSSERVMFGNYMKQSILHWVKEYHIDGFRFDLMGLHDVKIMNEIRQELNKLPNGKNLIMYGEPWAADYSPMEDKVIPAIKKNVSYLDENIAIFCDSTRDAIKGDVVYGEVPGFVNGGKRFESKIKSSIMAWCDNSVDWCPKSPKQIISYVSAHDNYTLWDKLVETMRREKDYTKKDGELIKINKLVAAILFTCQGTIFFQAGEEFARTKLGNDNSYNMSPEINKLDWKRVYEYEELVDYYKGLIALRSKITAFYSRELANINKVKFLSNTKNGVVAYILLNDKNTEDSWSQIYVAYNSTKNRIKLRLPIGEWQILLDGQSSRLFEKNIYYNDEITVESKSAVILGR